MSALIPVGYAIHDMLSLDRLQRLRNLDSYVARVPGIWHLLNLTFIFYLMLFSILVALPLKAIQFRKQTRMVQGSLGSFIVLLELGLLKRMLFIYLAQGLGMQRDAFSNLFSVLIGLPFLAVAVSGSLLAGEAETVVFVQKEFREVLDVLVGIFCWLWIPSSMINFSRWMVD